MKKSYLMIAAAAALFAACSSNDTFKEIDTQECAISFNPFTEKVTRAAIQGATGTSTVAGVKTLAEEGGFVVYGYKSTDEWSTKSNPDIFTGVNVYYDNNVWKYNGLRFWDKNAKYKFFAVAPYNPTDGATYVIDNDMTDDNDANATTKFGEITIDGAKSHIYSSSDDYLIDRNGQEENGSSHTNAANGNAAVSIDFHHIMAKVTFKLKSTLTTGKIKVTELKMKGYNNGAGKFVQDNSISGAPEALTIAEWSFISNDFTNNEVVLVGTGTGNATGIEFDCDPNSAAANIKDVADWYIMVPQTIAANGLVFTITYTFTDGDYAETFTNQTATVTSAQTWGTDSYTNYTLDIKPAEIKFNVTQICTFDYNNGNLVSTTD